MSMSGLGANTSDTVSALRESRDYCAARANCLTEEADSLIRLSLALMARQRELVEKRRELLVIRRKLLRHRRAELRHLLACCNLPKGHHGNYRAMVRSEGDGNGSREHVKVRRDEHVVDALGGELSRIGGPRTDRTRPGIA